VRRTDRRLCLFIEKARDKIKSTGTAGMVPKTVKMAKLLLVNG
jgi:hypothetical protein